MAEADDLRAEIAELRNDVERLRTWQATHICASPARFDGCTCPHPTVAAPFAQLPCPVHSVRPLTGYVSPYNVCGAAGGYAGVVTYLPGDAPHIYLAPTQGCAGGGSTLTFTFPAGQ